MKYPEMTKYEQILSHLPKIFFTPIPLPSIDGCIQTGIFEADGEKDNGIWLRLGDGNWYKLEETDHNYELVADAILNRLHGNNTL